MGRIFFFGDSITFGDGCNIGDEYRENYYKEGDKIWTDLVSEYFNMESKNFASSGCSSRSIISSFLKHIPEVTSDDKVVIFTGFYNRYDLTDKKGNNRVITNFLQENGDFTSNNYSKSDIDLLTKFSLRFILQDSYREAFFDDIFNYVHNNLKDKGIEHLIWSPAQISFYETLNKDGKLTISYHTAGKIKDYHFSFPGHVIFSNWVIEKFESKYTNLRGSFPNNKRLT